MQTNITTCIHTYKHVGTYMHVRAHVCTYLCADRHTCMHTYIHTCMHSLVHTLRDTSIHTYLHASVHQYKHTYIYTYLLTCILTCTRIRSKWRILGAGGARGGGVRGVQPVRQPADLPRRFFKVQNTRGPADFFVLESGHSERGVQYKRQISSHNRINWNFFQCNFIVSKF